MKGFYNKILRINLKKKTSQEETIPDSVYENYLGERDSGPIYSWRRILLELILFLPKTNSSSVSAQPPIRESMDPVVMVSLPNHL